MSWPGAWPSGGKAPGWRGGKGFHGGSNILFDGIIFANQRLNNHTALIENVGKGTLKIIQKLHLSTFWLSLFYSPARLLKTQSSRVSVTLTDYNLRPNHTCHYNLPSYICSRVIPIHSSLKQTWQTSNIQTSLCSAWKYEFLEHAVAKKPSLTFEIKWLRSGSWRRCRPV